MQVATNYMNTALKSEVFGDKFLITYSQKVNKVTLRKNGKIIAVLDSIEQAKEEFKNYKNKNYGEGIK